MVPTIRQISNQKGEPTVESDDIAQMAAVFKALSDKMRLRIVGLLAERPRAVEELAAATGLSAPTVSHHLGRLRAAGLVSSGRDQYYAVYRLEEGKLHEVGRRLGDAPAAIASSAAL